MDKKWIKKMEKKIFDSKVSTLEFATVLIRLKPGEEYEGIFLKNPEDKNCNELISKKLVAVQGECKDCIFHNHEDDTCNSQNSSECGVYDIILVEKK